MESETIQPEPVEVQIDLAQTVAQAKYLRQLARFNAGLLSFEEYKKLPRYAKRIYSRQFSVPKTVTEVRSAAKLVAKRRQQKKVAKLSRRRNRV